MEDLVVKAKHYAMLKHTGQVRKYTNEPYIVHPVAVVQILRDFNFVNETLLAAAYLHDVVEDTNTTIQDVLEEFGADVAQYVFYLTDFKHPKEGNRHTRKMITEWKISSAPIPVKLIKIADLIDNTKSIIQHDKDFAKQYLKEKENLLNTIRFSTESHLFIDKVADLWYEAEYQLTKAKELLND